MRAALFMLLACSAPRSLEGAWEVGFYAADAGPDASPLTCYLYAQPAGTLSGTWSLHVHDGVLSGQWDLCASEAAGSDLVGHIDDDSGAFDLTIAKGEVGIVEGLAGEQLEGLVTGLGPGIVLRGKRPSTGVGKSLPPPGD